MKSGPFDPCEVCYETEFGTTCRGYVAESAESPLTGKLRFRVVDLPSEAWDAEAGKWKYATDCWEV